MEMKMTQGDALPIPVILKQDGLILTPEMIQDVEISIGPEICKTYSGGGVLYQDEVWYIYVSQEETLRHTGLYRLEVRVRYYDQPWVTVLGKRGGLIDFADANSVGVFK